MTPDRNAVALLLAAVLLVAGLATAQSTAEQPPQEASTRVGAGTDTSCFELHVKLERDIVAADPSDPALPGMEVQARAALAMQEEGQPC